MEPQTQADRLRERIFDVYLELSEVSARMSVQIRGRAPGDYRSSLIQFKQLMTLMYSLSRDQLPLTKIGFARWQRDSVLETKEYALASIEMFEAYTKELSMARIITISSDPKNKTKAVGRV